MSLRNALQLLKAYGEGKVVIMAIVESDLSEKNAIRVVDSRPIRITVSCATPVLDQDIVVL